jgi:hypothetical protein
MLVYLVVQDLKLQVWNDLQWPIFMQSLMEVHQYVHNLEGEACSTTPGRDVSRLEWIVHILLQLGHSCQTLCNFEFLIKGME